MTGDSANPHRRWQASFSAYYEQHLLPQERQELEQHLAACRRCRSAYREFERTVTALPRLQKVAAPPEFAREVEATIHRRSAGRFFGRRTLADRKPIVLIAVVFLILALLLFALVRRSPTGSLGRCPSPSRDTRQWTAVVFPQGRVFYASLFSGGCARTPS